jgi:RNA polymerase sigma-70 factor (ECF subfamily)
MPDHVPPEQLAALHYDEVFKYLSRRVGKQDAEDLTQDVMLATVCRLDRFRGDSSFRHYLFTVAGRLCHAHLNRVVSHPVRSPQPLDQDATLLPAETVESLTAGALLSRRALDLVRDLVREYPHYGRAVEMHLLELSSIEVAQRLGVNYNTARSRISRGLSFLRVRLARTRDRQLDLGRAEILG